MQKIFKDYAVNNELRNQKGHYPKPAVHWIQLTLYVYYYDNASSHNIIVCRAGPRNTLFVRIPRLRYSPDIVICDFYQYGTLKQHLEAISAANPSDLRLVMNTILECIPQSQWTKSFDEWKQLSNGPFLGPHFVRSEETNPYMKDNYFKNKITLHSAQITQSLHSISVCFV